MRSTWLRAACGAACAAWALGSATLAGAAAEEIDIHADNLIAVLRETPGANKQDEQLRPIGKVRATLADGRQVEIDASWFELLGDMHVRLVFEGGQKMQTASPDDLQRLQLSPDQAVARAVENLRRRYGAPSAQPWTGGLMKVEGGAPDLNSSYFLDRDFWLAQLREHPQGLVVCVPQRGGLVFAPAGDELAITSLQFSAAALFADDGRARLSSALYLFKDGRWSVYQPAQPHY